MGTCNASPYVCVLPVEVRERESIESIDRPKRREGALLQDQFFARKYHCTGHRATMVMRTDSHGNGFREVLGLFKRHGISREMKKKRDMTLRLKTMLQLVY